LKIFDVAGRLMWAFDRMRIADGKKCLLSTPEGHLGSTAQFSLIEYHRERRITQDDPDVLPDEAGAANPNEGIRLLIWDLDDTFWQGTLSEGPISPITTNMHIVKTLNDRGIINAICSKNDFTDVVTKLRDLGMENEFVFPQIDWAPKGPMIKRIVTTTQLRPETIMFVDDNPLNLNEAKFFVPKLNVSDPGILDTLLEDPRFQGKPDPARTRLERYRVLERKQHEKVSYQGDNEKFLRESQIRVSFHTDVETEFSRVRELVNRTNQLNFTKNRWSENADEALAEFQKECSKEYLTNTGYVKVSDRYGNYGICGFYLVSNGICHHLLFSCRTMNMGVEQFVWNMLGRPFVQISGEVISDIDMPVDWITVVEDADAIVQEGAPAEVGERKTICIRGACDMSIMSNFLRTRADTIEELNYTYWGWGIYALPRIAALHDELQDPRNQAIIAQLPGIPPARFQTDIWEGRADAYVMSFSQETFYGLYRARSTGLTIPLHSFQFDPAWVVPKSDYTAWTYDDLVARNVTGISQEQWEFFRSEFEFVGGFNEDIFRSDISKIFSRLMAARKQVVILGMNTRIGRAAWLLEFFAKINSIVQPLSEEHGFAFIDISDYVRSEADLAPDGLFHGPHYSREVHRRLADDIWELVGARDFVNA
jgi:FkbH-like protein